MMLPDMDGMEVLRRMREHNQRIPVLFLTARDAVEDRIAGLTAGGDDYVTKPFSLEEVVARLRALMRRTAVIAADEEDSVIVVGDLTLDEDSHEVTRGGAAIQLTATEFELLRYLMRNPSGCCPRRRSSTGCGTTTSAARPTSSELYISYLRKKIDAGREPMIHTMRGVGYVLKPAADQLDAAPKTSSAPRGRRAGAHRRALGCHAWLLDPAQQARRLDVVLFTVVSIVTGATTVVFLRQVLVGQVDQSLQRLDQSDSRASSPDAWTRRARRPGSPGRLSIDGDRLAGHAPGQDPGSAPWRSAT